MIQFRYGHVATFVLLLCTLLLTTSRVQAQIQKPTPQHAPGGVMGYVKWGFGNDKFLKPREHALLNSYTE